MSVWNYREEDFIGIGRFFLISFLYLDLESYLRINFTFVHDHHFTLEDMNEMIPWERDIYVLLLKEWIKEENERIENENRKMKSRS